MTRQAFTIAAIAVGCIAAALTSSPGSTFESPCECSAFDSRRPNVSDYRTCASVPGAGDLVRLSPEEKQIAGAEPEDPVNEVEQDRGSHSDPARRAPRDNAVSATTAPRAESRAAPLEHRWPMPDSRQHHPEIHQHTAGVEARRRRSSSGCQPDAENNRSLSPSRT